MHLPALQVQTRRVFISWLNLLALVLLLGSAGCLRAPHLEPIRQELATELPHHSFKKEFKATLGRFSLGLTRNLLRWGANDQDVKHALHTLRGLRKVEIAVYGVQGATHSVLQIPQLSSLGKLFQRNGWELAMRIHEDSELLWMLVRERKGRLQEMLVVVLDEEELVMMRARGNLSQVITRALQQQRNPFKAEPTRTEIAWKSPEN